MRWLVLCSGLAIAAGCKQEDADRLARVSQTVTARVQQAAADADSPLFKEWHAVRQGWDEVTLAGRVVARLRWDKQLADVSIQVSVKGGEVELKGTIQNAGQRQRAVELAGSTTGVEKVHDSLEEPKE
jgi:osmotically-inducible protein OsmY